jgi:GNAT superfamily N-acetyltransferase
MSLSYLTKQGPAIESVFDDLARLRIAVFRDFPYLYEGSPEYEKEYLKTYAHSERAFLFAVYDGEKMVGATTCIPLKDETEEVQVPLKDAGLDIGSIFYFGESILLPKYRGLGLGHRFFDEREKHASSFGTYKTTCFCAVERINHPAQPADYRPNDAFWLKRGYHKMPDLKATMEWPDIGETISTPKTMIFWMKNSS